MCNTPKYAKLEERTGETGVLQLLALLSQRAVEIRVDLLCFPSRTGTAHASCRVLASVSFGAVGRGGSMWEIREHSA